MGGQRSRRGPVVVLPSGEVCPARWAGDFSPLPLKKVQTVDAPITIKVAGENVVGRQERDGVDMHGPAVESGLTEQEADPRLDRTGGDHVKDLVRDPSVFGGAPVSDHKRNFTEEVWTTKVRTEAAVVLELHDKFVGRTGDRVLASDEGAGVGDDVLPRE